VALEPPIPAPEIALVDGRGQPFRLSDLRGKVVALFFGYTTCPDVCPGTLAELRQIRRDLGPQASDLQVVFISVDPRRDTPQRVQEYVSRFDPSFIGLTGDESALQPTWEAYGVFREEVETDSAAGYLVNHSARTYLIDRTGYLRLTMNFGTSIDDVRHDILILLEERTP
jgi:protein SCO1/2